MAEFENTSTAPALLALQRFAGVHPRLLQLLMSRLGGLEQILTADRGALQGIEEIDDDQIDTLLTCADRIPEARRMLRDYRDRDIFVSARFDSGFPDGMAELNDPPLLLYHRGQLPDATRKSVAVVGTRTASSTGIELTSALAKRFAEEKVTVLSTLEGGTDVAAHLATKTARGTSFAILSTGLDDPALSELMPVAIDIVVTGGIISESAPDEVGSEATVAGAHRLLAALAQAVVITEGYQDSERVRDVLKCCNEIGKLAFLVIDPDAEALTDETTLQEAAAYGAIPMVGRDKVDDIIKALV